ncbi:MAG TPA: hypothetical protein PK883_00260 [Anaerolineaceae bacterium]|nr:hypothetical protein [Anaerolineaceae bacterium]
MKTLIVEIVGICLIISGCTNNPTTLPVSTPISQVATEIPAVVTPPENPKTTFSDNIALFRETNAQGIVIDDPFVARQRFVELNLALLLDNDMQMLPLKSGTEIGFNLFSDVAYVGIIDYMGEDEVGFTWAGKLKGVEYSEFTIVFTGGNFIANIASPEGVFEVSVVENDLYRIVLLDQNQLPGGDG